MDLGIFQRDLVVDGLAARTALNYRYATEAFLRRVEKPVHLITADTVRQYVYDFARERPRAASTVFNQLKAIRRFARWLVERGQAPADFTAGIRGPKPRDRVIEARQPAEVFKLMQAAASYGRSPQLTARNRALVALAFDSGCRISELLGLDVGDILYGKAIADRVRVRGKGGLDRIVSVNALPQGAVSDYLALRFDLQPDRPLFADQDGRRLTYVGARNMLQRIGGVAGVRVSWHDARRTAHTVMRLAGVNELDIQALGGWRSLAMVRRYTRSATIVTAIAAHKAHSPLAAMLAAGKAG